MATSTTAGLAFAAAVAGNANSASAENVSVPTPLFNAKPNGTKGCPPEVREALSGPWPTIKTSFTKDGAIDKAALNRQVDFLLDAKAKAIVLTWGDSLFSVLTDDEIAEVTRIVVERVNRRAYVVAATHQWWTGKAAEFTQYAAKLGADMIMGLPPDWANSTTVDQLVDYYAALGKHLPVMIVTNYLGRRGKGVSLSLCNRLMKEVPRVMALKDDLCNAVAHEIFLATRDRWSLSAGGQKRNHLQLLPFGVDGYLSTFMGFNPTIAHRYWTRYSRTIWMPRVRSSPITTSRFSITSVPAKEVSVRRLWNLRTYRSLHPLPSKAVSLDDRCANIRVEGIS